MYNILISGYYGFDNIGDESILRTLVTSLRERIPDCSLTVLSHDPAATRDKYGVEAVERMSPLAIARAGRRCATSARRRCSRRSAFRRSGSSSRRTRSSA